jgi:hypothetical protein
LDCHELARAQCIYAYQLKEIGVIDEIIWELGGNESEETYTAFPILASRIEKFILDSLQELQALTKDELVQQRYDKFRSIGTFALLDSDARANAISEANAKRGAAKKPSVVDNTACKLLQHIAQESISGIYSRYRNLAPVDCPVKAPDSPEIATKDRGVSWTNAKKELDRGGPEALVNWVKAQTKV